MNKSEPGTEPWGASWYREAMMEAIEERELERYDQDQERAVPVKLLEREWRRMEFDSVKC